MAANVSMLLYRGPRYGWRCPNEGISQAMRLSVSATALLSGVSLIVAAHRTLGNQSVQ